MLLTLMRIDVDTCHTVQVARRSADYVCFLARVHNRQHAPQARTLPPLSEETH